MTDEKPDRLWHATTSPEIIGGSLMPREKAGMGKVIFATDSLAMAYAYTLRTPTSVREAIDIPFKFSSRIHDGVLTVFSSHREWVTDGNIRSTIYTLPSDDFEQFTNHHGQKTPKWISRNPTPVEGVPATMVTTVNTVMQQGVQVFTVNPDRYHEISEWGKKILELPKGKYDPAILRYLGEMAEEGLLYHENAVRNINPVDTKTSKVNMNVLPQPSTFVDGVGRVTRVDVSGRVL